MHLAEDLRFGSRNLVRAPAFTATAILTLVAGLVVNTAMFGIVNALWFGPLPFRDDGQVTVITEDNRSKGQFGLVSYQDYSDLEASARSFQGMAAFCELAYNVAVSGPGGISDRVRGAMMSSSTLDMLGYRPLLGRGFTPDEDGSYGAKSGPEVVLIGEGMWRNRFGSDRDIIGRKLRINGATAVIVGVLPYNFRFIYAGYQVIAPLSRDEMASPRSDRRFQVLARLRHGATLDQARSELAGISARLASGHADSNEGWVAYARPYRQTVFGQAMKMHPVLMAAASLVLVVVCANIGNLLLAKMASRRNEMAIRTALGATARRLVAQVLTEGVLIASIGGALATLAAIWMRSLVVARYPELAVFTIDWRVAAYTLAITLVSAILFGLAPAWTAARSDVNETLKSSGVRAGLAVGRFRKALVVTQLALGLMLLGGTGMLVRTISELRNLDTGLNLSNVTITTLSLDGPRYADAERRDDFRIQLFDTLSAQPGIQAVAASTAEPLLTMAPPQRLEVAGRPSKGTGDYLRIAKTSVDPRFFAAVGIPFIAGRAFTPADRTQTVAIVNEKLAALLHPGRVSAAIGEKIRIGDTGDWHTIVGVVRDARQLLIEQPMPQVFSYLTGTPTELTVIVKSSTTATAGEWIRHAVRDVDPDVAIGEVMQQADIVEKFYPKVMIGGLAAFSAITLGLGALGLYGVMSFLVAGNARELAVRIALGATRVAISRMVVGQAIRMTFVGILLGLGGAFALCRVLASMIYGAGSANPEVFAGIVAVFIAVAILATVVPALRATRVDPIHTLRSD